MANKMRTTAAGFVVLHGLVHLMGAAVYLRIAVLDDLPYKTTILAGRIDLGEPGIGLFGLIWLLAAAVMAGAGWALWAHAAWAKSLLLAAALLSLIICGLDFDVAGMGIVANVIILAVLLRSSIMPVLSMSPANTQTKA